MTASRGETVPIDSIDEPDSNSISDHDAAANTSMAQSVVARLRDIWLTVILAVALGVLLLAFVVDVDPVVLFGIGLIVFALYLWWFVSTGVGILNRLGD